jgi:hypothetical protein
MIGHLVGRCLRAIGLQKPIDFLGQTQAQHPDYGTLRLGKMVIVRDGKIDKWACFRCPCGCEEKIQLSLSTARRPRWMVETDWFGRPSLKPSVRQTAGCKAHFWVRSGRVEWCADSPARNRSVLARP